ncbi:MAG: AI-2E family transporter, partial [Planctomycetota bacterium]
QIKEYGIPLFSAAAGAGVGILKFVVSIIIAGVLLANAAGGGHFARAFATRLTGERGAKAVELAGATVRSVALGILGVALIQTLLAGIGFLAVGVPGAGLWALLVLILAVNPGPDYCLRVLDQQSGHRSCVRDLEYPRRNK